MSGERSGPVVLAAPSGTGKTTIARRLVAESPDFAFSVSATTRPRRPGERQGVDYDFVTPKAFRRMIDQGEFCEWAEVHGQLYGTPFRTVETAATRGERVVLDIDVQGADQIRKRVAGAVLIFLLPPSARALVERLVRRGTERRDEILRRLRNARDEVLAARRFDHVVVNEDLDVALDTIRALVRGEGSAEARAEDPEAWIARLRADIDEEVRRLEEED